MTQAAPRKLEPFDLFGIEMALNVWASPDGKEIACLVSKADLVADAFQQSLWLTGRQSRKTAKLDLADEALMCRLLPDGALLVVTAGEDGVNLLRRDHGGLTRIANLPAAPSAMAVSPNGQRLALRMNVPEDKVQIALPERPEGAVPAEPAFYTERVDWRLDGVGMQDSYAQVFALDLASGTLEQLTFGMTPSGYYSEGLAWSPDGGSILFVSSLRPDWHKEPFNTEIYSLETATRQITCLTRRFGVELDPKLSPDGT